MVKYTKTIKKNYEWIKYEQFKKLEKEVILEENHGINNNVVDSLIEAVNGLNISEVEKNDINVSDQKIIFYI